MHVLNALLDFAVTVGFAYCVFWLVPRLIRERDEARGAWTLAGWCHRADGGRVGVVRDAPVCEECRMVYYKTQ